MHINGRNAILEALRSERGVEKVYIMYGVEGDAIARVRAEASRRGVPCTVIDRKRFSEMERTAGIVTRSQGVIALVPDVAYVDVEDLVYDLFERGESPLIAVLDGITDPHNIGAIIRSAECAGLHGIIIGTRHSGGVNDTVMKTSAGAASHLPIARPSNIGDVLLGLKQEGMEIVTLDGNGTVEYTGYDFTHPTAVVIGSEGEGVGSRLRKMSDHLLSIPMAGKIASLNASVAAGVVFFEAMRQRAGGDATRRERAQET